MASAAPMVVDALDRDEIGDPVWRQPARRATCLFSVRALSEVFKAKFNKLARTSKPVVAQVT